MINNTPLILGTFDFISKFLAPLWGIVGIVFIAIIILLSRTIIRHAKKIQRGEVTSSKALYLEDLEPYEDIPYYVVDFTKKEGREVIVIPDKK